MGAVDLPVTQRSAEKLKQLEWLIGQWVDRDEGASIETSCTWAPNNAFLRRSFKVAVQDRVDLAGLQVIGWDDEADQFRSWVFDSAGGFASDRWEQNGDRWIIKSAGVLFDGQTTSSVRILTPIDADSASLQVVDREAGGVLLPDIDPVTIVRQSTDQRGS